MLLFIFIVLAILSTLATLRVILDIYKNKRHVSDELLIQLMRNDLNTKVKPRVINHLGQCRQCRDRLNEINGFDPNPF